MPQFVGMWKAWPAGLWGLALLAVAPTLLASHALAAPLGATVVQLRDLPDPLLVEPATPPPAAPAAAGDSPPPWASYVALVNYGSAPSVQGAVGPAHVVVMTTDYLRVLTRSGDVLHTVRVRDLAAVDERTDCLAASLVFDAYRNRFVAAVAQWRTLGGPRRLRILASHTADALGPWVAHDVDSYKLLHMDRPRLAVTAKLVLIHAAESLQYSSQGYAWFLDASTVGAQTKPKGWMTKTDPRLAPTHVPPDEADRTEFLAWNPGAGTALVRYVVKPEADAVQVLSITHLNGMKWTWSATKSWPPTIAAATVALHPVDSVGRGQVRGGLSWWAVPAATAPGAASGVAWFAVADSGQVVHQGVLTAGGSVALAYPSLAVAADLSVLLGYASVEPSGQVGATYALRGGDDPADTLRAPYALQDSGKAAQDAGCAPQCSLGPWSATALDPVRADLLWTFQPATPAAGGNPVRHSVVVAAVSLPCGATLCGACQQCAAGKCVALAESSPCFDGKPCTENDRCHGGVCSGTTKACNETGLCHQAGGCDPTTGACVLAPRNEGQPCDDDALCTVEDRCTGGGCLGVAKPCPPTDACHYSYCDGISGACRTEPTGAPGCPPEMPAAAAAGCAATAPTFGLPWLVWLAACVVVARWRRS